MCLYKTKKIRIDIIMILYNILIMLYLAKMILINIRGKPRDNKEIVRDNVNVERMNTI